MSSKKATTSKASKRSDDGKPKRSCNAFCFFLRDKSSSMKSFGPDNMKALHDQWRQLDAKHREPYERAAAADANRYRREKERWESSRQKRPCNAYIQFIQSFMAKHSGGFDNVCSAVSAGAAEWKRMSDAQKAPWQKLASAASKKYAATKPTVAKAKPKPAVAKPKAAVAKAKAKLTVTKLKAKVKLSAAKPKTMPKASAAKTTKRKIAGTKTQPKTIKKTKIHKTK